MTTDEVAKTALSTHAVTSSVINDKQATETTALVAIAMAGEVSNSNPTSPIMTKGGQLQVPNEDIKAAVAYMISQVQQP